MTLWNLFCQQIVSHDLSCNIKFSETYVKVYDLADCLCLISFIWFITEDVDTELLRLLALKTVHVGKGDKGKTQRNWLKQNGTSTSLSFTSEQLYVYSSSCVLDKYLHCVLTNPENMNIFLLQ